MRKRSAFTLVELLVVIAIIGILVSLLMPAVQQAREAARRMQCGNNLKQLGLALHTYHTSMGSFPPGRDGYGDEDHSWVTFILPQMEQQNLFDKYDWSLDWDEGGNHDVTSTDLAVQLCPSSDHQDPGQGDYGGINGPGNHPDFAEGWQNGRAWNVGVFPGTGDHATVAGNGPVSMAMIRDGTTNTMMVGEDAGRTDAQRFWGHGDQTYAHHGVINTSRSNELYSDHPGGVQILLADGSVHFLSESTSKTIIDALATRSHGETIDASSW